MLAIHLHTATKTNMAALELMRHLGLDYKAAWRIKHKIVQAVTEREARRQLSGFAQIDDAYLGGELSGRKPGQGSPNKQAFLIAVETDAELEHPCHAVIEPVRGFDNQSIRDGQRRHLSAEAEVFSDGLFCFRRFADAGHAHPVLETEGARWVNVVLANVKRAISGRYHAIRQSKYARRYLAEAAYRFNRRFQLSEVLSHLVRTMMGCKPCAETCLRMIGWKAPEEAMAEEMAKWSFGVALDS